MYDLPDAPWIRDAELNGMPEPFDPYDHSNDSDLLDYIFDKNRVHEIWADYLMLDPYDLEGNEDRCQSMYSAMDKHNPIMWREFVTRWLNRADLRDEYNEWWYEHHRE